MRASPSVTSVPEPAIDQLATKRFAPPAIVALPPASASVPVPLTVPLRVEVPVKLAVSPLPMLSVDPALRVRGPELRYVVPMPPMITSGMRPVVVALLPAASVATALRAV